MKKWIAFVSTAVLTLGMTLSAFAAGSPQIMGVVSGVDSVVDNDGKIIEIEVQPYTQAEFTEKEAEEVKTLLADAAPVVEEVLGAEVAKTLVVVDAQNVVVDEGVSFPIKVTFNVSGVTASSTVKMLGYAGTDQAAGAFRAIWSRAYQLCSSTTVGAKAGWVEIPCTVADGKVTATMDFAGPVVFLTDKETASVMSGKDQPTTKPDKENPDTGDHTSALWFGVVAVVAGAVLVVSMRNKKA